MGKARFTEPKTVQVALNVGGTQSLRGEREFREVGTRTTIPDMPGLVAAGPMTRVVALNLERLPDHLVILGGGDAHQLTRWSVRRAKVVCSPAVAEALAVRQPYSRHQAHSDVSTGIAFPQTRDLITEKQGGSTMLRSSRTRVTALAAVLAGIAGLSYMLARSVAPATAASPDAQVAPVEFTADGKLKQPVGYRKWVYVGEVVTPNDLNDGEATFPEFHSVYIDPESFAHYEKTGEFRDGTVLIKELSSVGTKKASSGNGYFQGAFTGLEAEIKDSKRFKDEPGNWAYFSFGHKYPLKAEVAKGAVASCNQCHEQNAKKTDWVFSQYYPALRAAAPHSK
jgi:hypothetical protein